MSAARPPRLRTNWFRVLADLERVGCSNLWVARVIGVPFSTLSGWKAGSEPAHNYGNDLIELWCEVMGTQPKDRPMVMD